MEKRKQHSPMHKKPIKLSTKMKDPKTIAIAVLVLLVLIFGATTFFKKDSLYKYKLEELQKVYDAEHKKRDSLDQELVKVRAEFAALKVKERQLAADVARLDQDIASAKNDAKRSKEELGHAKASLEETRKKIANLKSNPPNRTGEDLLNSLKLKTQN
jgi:peptidoglycan hydrolase CwlO-like protein